MKPLWNYLLFSYVGNGTRETRSVIQNLKILCAFSEVIYSDKYSKINLIAIPIIPIP